MDCDNIGLVNIQGINTGKSIWDSLTIREAPGNSEPQDTFQKSEPSPPDFMAMLHRRLKVVPKAEVPPAVASPTDEERFREAQRVAEEESQRRHDEMRAAEEEQSRQEEAIRRAQAEASEAMRQRERSDLQHQIHIQESEISRLQQQCRNNESWGSLRPEASGWAQDSWAQDDLRAAEKTLSDLRSRMSRTC